MIQPANRVHNTRAQVCPTEMWWVWLIGCRDHAWRGGQSAYLSLVVWVGRNILLLSDQFIFCRQTMLFHWCTYDICIPHYTCVRLLLVLLCMVYHDIGSQVACISIVLSINLWTDWTNQPHIQLKHLISLLTITSMSSELTLLSSVVNNVCALC